MIDPPRAAIVGPGGVRTLTQVDVRARDEDEHWLQDLVFRHPEVLPINEISGEFGPAVPLGMEVDGIDALFVSPRGYLTIVETKLVDNPRYHQEVCKRRGDYPSRLIESKPRFGTRGEEESPRVHERYADPGRAGDVAVA